MTEPPTLAYPDFDLPFILHTDASGAGLGCGLFQIQDGSIRVIGDGSRRLTGSEEKYHSSKLEFLALKWAICDHFKDCLFCSPNFEVYTDFNSLTYIKTSCKVKATVIHQQNNNESWIPTVNVLSTSCNDIQAEILYKGGDAAACSFTRDNIGKAQDQEDSIKK